MAIFDSGIFDSGIFDVEVDVGPPELPAKTPGAGRLRRKYQRRYVVEVDGQDFVVTSEEEAQSLLQTAVEVAEEVVQKVVAEPEARAKVPRIRVRGEPGPELQALVAEVAAVRIQIRAMYEKALRDAEIGVLIRREVERQKRIEDDEEAIALAMML